MKTKKNYTLLSIIITFIEANNKSYKRIHKIILLYINL